MKNFLLTALLILSIAPVYAKQAKHKKKKAKPAIESVTLHRTACFGRCPDYTVEISNDGWVTYTGIRFTPDTGVFRKNIGKSVAAGIMSRLQTNRVDTCRNLYENRIPDLPGITYTIQFADSTKKISNANFGPTFLSQTADDIDKLGRKSAENNEGWKKVAAKKTK